MRMVVEKSIENNTIKYFTSKLADAVISPPRSFFFFSENTAAYSVVKYHTPILPSILDDVWACQPRSSKVRPHPEAFLQACRAAKRQ